MPLVLKSLAVIIASCLFLLPQPAAAQTNDLASSPLERRFLITEINLGNHDNPYNPADDDPDNDIIEYVVVTNISDAAQAPAGLTIEYLKTADEVDSAVCNLFPWPAGELGADYTEVELDDTELLEPGDSVVVMLSLTNSRGGSLRLTEFIDDTLLYHDLVGWNRGSSASDCYQQQAVDIDNDLTATRVQHYNLDFADTDNNQADFALGFGPVVDLCANIDDVQITVPDGFKVNELGECSEDVIIAPLECDVVIISEILPNPDGSDSGNEFIELHNPTTEQVSLDGCSLQVDDGKEIKLDGTTIETGKYLAVNNLAFSFNLPNASGGTVYLLSPTDEIDMVVYPGGLDSDQSYSRFNDGWRATYSSTPNLVNILTEFLPCPAGQFRNPDTNRCNNIVAVDNELADCGVGRYRHPDTNRCRNIESDDGLKPCDPGEYRNPATNRCRQIASATSTLKPCAANQYRNPETNRCKKVESETKLKPCRPGQQRNPATNRCRNVATLASATASHNASSIKNQTEPTGPEPASINLPLVFAASTGVIGYGLYEYRQDLRAWIWRIKRWLGR